MGDEGGGALVFGSAPATSLAAEYARGIGATHALSGALEGDRLRTSLIGAADARELARFDTPVDERALPFAEGTLATAVARALGLRATEEVLGRLGAPPATDARAYRALLVGMDLEMTATVLRRDRPEEAERSLRGAVGSYLDALRAEPACDAAEERLLYLVAEQVERGAAEHAMEILEDLIGVNPRAWRAHYMLGELRRESGLHAQAVVAFELSDALHPLSDADQVRLAQLYAQTDALDTAAARLRRIRPASPQFASAQEELGHVLMRKGDLRGAVGAFERARAAGARSGSLFARLGQSHAGLGDLAAARAAFEEGLANDDGSWGLPAAYAGFLHGEADLSRGIALYRQAVERGAPPATRLNLARALIVTGRKDEAASELAALLATPAEAETTAQARRLRLGLEHPEEERRLEEAGQIAVGAREGDVAAARETLTALAASHGDLWETHFGLGLTARRAGDAAAAEASFRRALERWPGQPDVEHELGVALLMQGKTDEAVLALEEASRYRPNDAGYLADVGFAYMVAGNLHAARNRLERARELDPEDQIMQRYVAELEKREATAAKPS